MTRKENKDAVYRNAKPREKAYTVSDGSGLVLMVHPKGGKYWQLRYRFNDKQKTLAIGVYPEISLLEARKQRQSARELLRHGIDPSEQKKADKAFKQEKAGNTFEKIARRWHTHLLSTWQPSTARDTIYRLEKDIFPAIGHYPIDGIKPRQLIKVLKDIEERGAKEIAKRLRANMERIFNYAITHGHAEVNPASPLKKDVLTPAPKGHFASITPDELPEFLKAMRENKARLYLPTRIALHLMMLTFLRTSELIETPWSEIDLEKGEWVIPWQRMKMGKRKMNPRKDNHVVPLCSQALELLKELHGLTGRNQWLFPNQRDPQKPMSNGAILMALKRMGYKNKMTGHGFRALAMTTLKERLHYRHEVVDRQLAHAQRNEIDSAYDRAKFLEERKKMMQEWADYLDAVEAGANVIHGSFRAA